MQVPGKQRQVLWEQEISPDGAGLGKRLRWSFIHRPRFRKDGIGGGGKTGSRAMLPVSVASIMAQRCRRWWSR